MKKVSIFVLSFLLLHTSLFCIPSNLDKLIKTVVNDEPLNVRNLPSTKGEKVGKLFRGDEVIVAGFSDARETIDGYNGYWVKIATFDEKFEYWDFSSKWVFSKYIDIDHTLDVSTIKAGSFFKDEKRPTLDIEIKRKDETVYPTVELNHLDGQDFYTFNWMYDYFTKDFFSSSDPTGTFVYYPSNNEIKHITYLGETEESAWGLFSNDFRFFMQDFGTSPGVRALSVTDLTTNKAIFHGSHYKDIEYDGESIIIVETSSFHANPYDIIPETERLKAKKENKKFTREDLKDKEIVDRYRLNLYTLEVTYVDSVLAFVQ